MSASDDLDGVSEHPLPEELVERLLTGGSPGVGVDEPTVAVAQVLQAARQAPSAQELAEADAAAATFLRTMAGAATTNVLSLDAHRRRRAGRVSTRVAAGVAAITLFSAGAAAAATGHLPDPVQRTVAQAVSHVGVDLPTPDDANGEQADAGTDDEATATSAPGSSSSSSPASTAAAAGTASTASSSSAATTPSSATSTSTGADQDTEDGSAASTPVGPDVTGEAKKGLCTAYEKQRKNGDGPNGAAFDNLRAAAEGTGKTVDEYCADVLAPTTEPTAPEGSRPSTATTAAETEGSTSVPKPKGPPATYKGPDEPVTSTDRTLPPQANGTIPSATSVKPGNGNGGGGNK